MSVSATILTFAQPFSSGIFKRAGASKFESAEMKRPFVCKTRLMCGIETLVRAL